MVFVQSRTQLSTEERALSYLLSTHLQDVFYYKSDLKLYLSSEVFLKREHQWLTLPRWQSTTGGYMDRASESIVCVELTISTWLWQSSRQLQSNNFKSFWKNVQHPIAHITSFIFEVQATIWTRITVAVISLGDTSINDISVVNQNYPPYFSQFYVFIISS